MKKFLYQISINYKRIVFRNPMFFGFGIFMPIAFYLIFTKLVNVGIPTEYLKTNYLIAMAIYSAMISSIISLANTLLEDREHHFTLFVELSPASKLNYYGGMLFVFLPLQMFITIMMGLVGMFVNGVSISLTIWLAFIVLLPILSVPLILIGVLVSLAGTSNAVNGVAQLITLPMAMLSGLWWPIDMLPSWLQHIGKSLPPYQISTIIQEVVHQQTVRLDSILGLLIWTLSLALLLTLIIRYMQRHELQTI